MYNLVPLLLHPVDEFIVHSALLKSNAHPYDISREIYLPTLVKFNLLYTYSSVDYHANTDAREKGILQERIIDGQHHNIISLQIISIYYYVRPIIFLITFDFSLSCINLNSVPVLHLHYINS